MGAGEQVQQVDVTRVTSDGVEVRGDAVAIEAPLEVRIDGVSFVTTMRTPGADAALAVGLLLAEHIVRRAADVEGADVSSAGGADVVNVRLAPDARARAEARLASRNLVTTTSACGVCGRAGIDDLVASLSPLPAAWTVPAAVVSLLPSLLREAQQAFAATGGLHASGLFDQRGRLLAAAEDVGRHNAVDKIIGGELLAGRWPLTHHLLCVSGRTSFEIVQKAAAAGIGVVAAVSAPSSLAIELARRANLTLIGFVRDGAFNVYTVPDRVET